MLLAPLAYAITKKLNTRLTCIVGVVIASSSLALTSVIENPALLFIVYGLMLGVASALLLNPVYFLLDEYFPYKHPRHVLTTSLGTCGFPLGQTKFLLTLKIHLNQGRRQGPSKSSTFIR